MTDRELLELAAKAADIGFNPEKRGDEFGRVHTEHLGLWIWHWGEWWNPLTDDGDAFRLAVKCKIDAVHFSMLVRADVDGLPSVSALYNGDPAATTRRAIVRAAAEIGRRMRDE